MADLECIVHLMGCPSLPQGDAEEVKRAFRQSLRQHFGSFSVASEAEKQFRDAERMRGGPVTPEIMKLRCAWREPFEHAVQTATAGLLSDFPERAKHFQVSFRPPLAADKP